MEETINDIVNILSSVSKKSFLYKNDWVDPPKEIWISKDFFKNYDYKEECNGHSLDYFLGWRWDFFKQKYPKQVKYFKKRIISINNYNFFIFSYFNKKDCIFKKKECLVKDFKPFYCALKPIKFIREENKGTLTKEKSKEFPFDKESFKQNLLLLKEMKMLAFTFHLPTWLDEILNYLKDLKTIPDKNIKIH